MKKEVLEAAVQRHQQRAAQLLQISTTKREDCLLHHLNRLSKNRNVHMSISSTNKSSKEKKNKQMNNHNTIKKKSQILFSNPRKNELNTIVMLQNCIEIAALKCQSREEIVFSDKFQED